MLTEAEVQRRLRRLVSVDEVDQGTFEKAELLLEQLRPESPLRHRLTTELEELRKIKLCGAES